MRHGKLTGFDAAGRKLTEEDYQDGTLHGASRRWFSDGRVAEEGSNAKGQKQGIWTSYIPTEQFAPLRIDYGQQILGWEAGLPHGVWEWRSPADKPLAQFKFARGRLVSKLPAGADVRLGELAAVGKLDPDTLFAVLKPLARQEFVETPLEDVANGLAEAAEVELYFDAKPDVLQSTEDYEIAADTPLLVALGQLLVPHKLACDHRYGMLWIAPAEEIAKWKDTTGISAIVPPAGSKLAEVWETPVSAQFVETPLVDGLQYLAKQTKHRLTLGDTRNIPSWTVTLNLHNHPLKHVLAIMLNQARFRCRLDGEKLFVEEQPFE
ncbi:MAG: hypothetical protein SFU86_01535 [Pirellulaceae bacterium]|nr:hypothetical protein [Pirellulaceae bacterium]